jgi:hypothetical protein
MRFIDLQSSPISQFAFCQQGSFGPAGVLLFRTANIELH